MKRLHALVVLVFALLSWGVPRAAWAEAPRVSLRAANDTRGPVELERRDNAWTGAFFIDNLGDAPMTVSRISVREDDAVRVPRVLTVDGEGVRNVAPHASRKVKVTWTPDANALPEVWAHVVVTTNDEQAGEVAIGVHAQTATAFGPLEGRLLSALFLLPLLGALAALGFKLVFPQGRPRTARRVAIAVAVLQLGLAAAIAWRFRPEITRLDGNDGLQLVERVVWIRPLSVEWYVGLDGHAMLLVLLVATVGALGAIASARVERDVEGYFGLWLAAIAGATGVAIARDLVLLLVMVGLATLPIVALIGGWGRRREQARAAAGAAAVSFAVALVLLAVCATLLHYGASRTFLVDGSATARGFALPELERVAYTRAAGTVGGIPIVEAAFVAGLLGFGLLAGLVPLHPWLPTAAGEAPAPVTALIVAIVPRLGIVGMVRVLAGVMPEGSRWASAATVGLGAITALHAGGMLLSERDLSRVAAFVAMTQSGIALVGLGSITPQGLVATGAIVLGGGLATATLALWAGALDERLGTRDTSAIGGLFGETPLLAMLAAVAFAGAMGAPGTVGFWGDLLAVIGAVGAHRALSALVVLALALKGAAVFRVAGRVLFGATPAAWRGLAELEPFGGKFPELRTHEGWAMVPLAVATVVLGVWPAPLLGVLAGAVRDAVARGNLGPLQVGF
jgi:NADH-quinone oxidoreductase subunit M